MSWKTVEGVHRVHDEYPELLEVKPTSTNKNVNLHDKARNLIRHRIWHINDKYIMERKIT
jgi:hypothetical protein